MLADVRRGDLALTRARRRAASSGWPLNQCVSHISAAAPCSRSCAVALRMVLAGQVFAQPRSARERAPRCRRRGCLIDLTSYWVAVVSEDWRHRMATPLKGRYESLPLQMREPAFHADGWNLDADNSAGVAGHAIWCRRLDPPARPLAHHAGRRRHAARPLRRGHADTAARVREHGRSRAREKTWQGFSRAQWQRPPQDGGGLQRAQIGNNTGPIAPRKGGRGQRGGPDLSPALAEGGSLKVVTTNFRAGYLRNNGVPQSESASFTATGTACRTCLSARPLTRCH